MAKCKWSGTLLGDYAIAHIVSFSQPLRVSKSASCGLFLYNFNNKNQKKRNRKFFYKWELCSMRILKDNYRQLVQPLLIVFLGVIELAFFNLTFNAFKVGEIQVRIMIRQYFVERQMWDQVSA